MKLFHLITVYSIGVRVLVLLRTVMYMLVIVIVFVAYRAILAEPRTKAATTEDYSGAAARVDYMGGNDSMNQYALPLGTQLFDCIINYLFNDSSKDVINYSLQFEEKFDQLMSLIASFQSLKLTDKHFKQQGCEYYILWPNFKCTKQPGSKQQQAT